jgi:hypothetical protein
MELPPADFESAASASSAIPALPCKCIILNNLRTLTNVTKTASKALEVRWHFAQSFISIA